MSDAEALTDALRLSRGRTYNKAVAGLTLGGGFGRVARRFGLALDNVGVPREIVTIMQGSIVLSVVVAYEVVRRFELASEQRRVGRELATVGGAA